MVKTALKSVEQFKKIKRTDSGSDFILYEDVCFIGIKKKKIGAGLKSKLSILTSIQPFRPITRTRKMLIPKISMEVMRPN